MTRSLRFLMRLALVIAVVAALQLVTGTSRQGASPYVSSLSSLGVSAASTNCLSDIMLKPIPR